MCKPPTAPERIRYWHRSPVEANELDGETNLKIKTSLRDANETLDISKWNTDDYSSLVQYINQSVVECDAPNVKLSSFKGTLFINEGTSKETKISIDFKIYSRCNYQSKSLLLSCRLLGY